jgi:cytochrome P450
MKFEPFDPLSPDHQADPFRSFEDLAARGPLHRTRSGLWLVSGHALTGEILRHRGFRTEYGTALARTYGADYLSHAALRSLDECFVLRTDKAQGEIRKLFARTLSPANAQAHSDAIRRHCEEQIARASRGDPLDTMRDFAVPFTLQVVCLLLGMPATLAADVPRVSSGLLKALDCARLDSDELEDLDGRTAAVCARLTEYLATPAAQESACMARLIELAREHSLSLESISTDVLFILLAGFETTSTMVAQIPHFLNAHPQVRELISADNSVIPAVVEEYCRLHPAIHMVTRRPSETIVAGGTTFARGATLLVLLGAANRDPAVFAEPGRFVLGRPKAMHYSFGAGAHSCVGGALARHELTIAFETLSRQHALLGEYRASWRRMGVFRSLDSMQLGARVPVLQEIPANHP